MSTLTETQESAFDAGVYDLPIPSLDGNKADRLAVSFSGGLELDRTSEEDLEFLKTLRLGRTVQLSVEAIVTRSGFTYAAGREDEDDRTGFGVGLKVVSVEVA